MFRYLSLLALTICLLMAASNTYADTSIINEYDATGNLVTGDGRYYEYNDANQLARVRQGDQSGPVIAEYFYDSSGQRVKKVENGVVTYYIGKHYEKQVGGSNEGNTSYYFGEGGERVAKKDPSGNVFYYHLDHLDGVNVVTDSSGAVIAKTDYLPFGDVRAGSSGTEKYSYTDKEKDKTSLYYFHARYNSPEFRHFTQADLADPDFTDPQDLNRYSYVGNNPLSYVDDDGFKKKKKKKKAKLSEREKWMIAHGSDPDKDKTSLKKAKEQFKAGTKYTAAAKPSNPTGSGTAYRFAGGEMSGTQVAQSGYTSNNREREKLLHKKISLLQMRSAYQLEADAWNNYIEQIDYATKFFKVVKWSADLGLYAYSGGASGAVQVSQTAGIKALYKSVTTGITLYKAFNNQLSNTEMLCEATKLTVEAAIGDTEVGKAVSFGFNAVVDLWQGL